MLRPQHHEGLQRSDDRNAYESIVVNSFCFGILNLHNSGFLCWISASSSHDHDICGNVRVHSFVGFVSVYLYNSCHTRLLFAGVTGSASRILLEKSFYDYWWSAFVSSRVLALIQIRAEVFLHTISNKLDVNVILTSSVGLIKVARGTNWAQRGCGYYKRIIVRTMKKKSSSFNSSGS